MTELTDEAVKALLDPFASRSGTEALRKLKAAAPDLARALLDARAEAGKMLAEADHDYNRKTNDLIERHAKQISTLAAELAQARADAWAAVAVALEGAAAHIVSEAEKLADGMEQADPALAFLKELAAEITALAPADGLAAVEALRNERDRIDQWRETAIVERDTYSEERDAAEAERDRLAAELAQSRADTDAEVALVLEYAARALDVRGQQEQVNFGLDRCTQNFYRARDIVRSLAPADGLAPVEALRKERDNALELAEERLRGQHRLSNQLNDTVRDLSAELAASRAREAGLVGALSAAVEYMAFHSTLQCEPYPLDKCRAELAKVQARDDGAKK